MSVTHELHVAYSYSPKFKNYFASAYVLERNARGALTFKFAHSTGMGDTVEEAENEALFRVTTGVPRATNVTGTTRHGRKSLEVVKGYAFP